MGNPDYKGAKTFARKFLRENISDKLIYHNEKHTIEVVKHAENLYEKEFSDQEKFEEDKILLLTAAEFHDTGYAESYTMNEIIGVRIASQNLLRFGYSNDQIDRINSMIMAIEMPQKPLDHLEQVLCDADLYHLGTENFFERSELFRKELAFFGMLDNLGLTDIKDWYDFELDFMNKHSYFTESARKELEMKKAENFAIIRRKRDSL